MNKQAILLFIVVLTLVSASAVACIYMNNNRRLGNPGLKMVKAPVYDVKGNVVGNETVDLPLHVLNYDASTNLPVSLEELGWLPKDTSYGRRIYQTADKFGLFLSVVIMGTDSRSIHKPEICLPGQGWRIESREMQTIPIEKPSPYELPVMKITASKEGQLRDGTRGLVRALYVYWFIAEDDLTADHFDRNWKMGVELIRSGTLQRWAYIACMANCLPGQEKETYERVKKFIAASVPEFQLTHGKPAETKLVSSSIQ